MTPVANDARDLSANGSTPLLEGATRRRRLERASGRSVAAIASIFGACAACVLVLGAAVHRRTRVPSLQMAIDTAGIDGPTDPTDGSLPTGGPVFRLHFACSPLNYVTDKFNPGAWTGAVGARVVTKGMSSDFLFESGVEMAEIGCGAYELLHVPIAKGEEFGFFVYPKGQEGSDEKTISDIGCEHAGSSKCPAFAVPAAAIGMEACTKNTTAGEDTFFNRVYDGVTVDYTWGSCDNSCVQAHPTGCVADPVPASDLPHQDQPDIPVPARGVTMPAFPKLGANHRQAFRFWRIRYLNDDLKSCCVLMYDVQFFTDKSNYIAGVKQNKTEGHAYSGSVPLSGLCFESDQLYSRTSCTGAFDYDPLNTYWRAKQDSTGNEPGSLGQWKRLTWSYVGLELPQAKNVQHVRINNGIWGGAQTFSQTGPGVLVVECSDDGDNWYEWSGGRLTVENKSIYRSDTSNARHFWEDIVK